MQYIHNIHDTHNIHYILYLIISYSSISIFVTHFSKNYKITKIIHNKILHIINRFYYCIYYIIIEWDVHLYYIKSRAIHQVYLIMNTYNQ